MGIKLQLRGAAAAAAAVLAALSLVACGDRQDAQAPKNANDTSAMGGFGTGPRTQDSAAAPGLAPGIAQPAVPRGSTPQFAMIDDTVAVALWEQQGDVMVSRWTGARWEPPQPLERIGGESSNPRVASNQRGVAMAIWQHSVGRIESLRYSRFESGKGWTAPDVMPGALPRARQPGKTAGASVDAAAPRIEVDASGNARAEWRSGFDENEVQASTHVPGEGWARPVDLPLQASAGPSDAK